MNNLRSTTLKPVATTEVLDSYYSNPEVRELGDWVSPNVHPYWNGARDPQQAVRWTQQQFTSLSDLYVNKTVFFKEVGLPTAGDPGVSEENQANYYRLLRDTNVKFSYFEAFDQTWKDSQSIEPHWGLFHSDRSPKPVVDHVCRNVSSYLPAVLR
jgi:exo-beta-1,3-glucanase (GH17 family)